jgi:hypothetical protein
MRCTIMQSNMSEKEIDLLEQVLKQAFLRGNHRDMTPEKMIEWLKSELKPMLVK